MAPKILVLRLSSLGDVILCSSFLKSLREHFPEAAVDFVVRSDLEPVAAMLPGVDRVLAIERDAGPWALWRTSGELARQGYAHVFDLHQSLRSRLLSSHLWSRRRPGFDKQSVPRWALVHLHRDWYRRFGNARSLRERTLEPLRRLGFEPRLHPTELRIPQEARREAEALLKGAAPAARWIGVVPGARWPTKRWPGFADLVRTLAAESDHLRFAIVGAREDAEVVARVGQACGERGVDLAGRLDLPRAAAVLERCELVITNDSGLLHMAEAVGRPVLAFFGSTSPSFGYAPYRPESRFLYHPPPCSPCSKNGSRPCHRPTHECMLGIKVEEAAAAAAERLAQGGARRPG